MAFGPAGSKEVVILAEPEPVRGPVPNVVAPSLNVTVPVGVPTRLGVIWAVKIIVWPSTEELREEVSAVVVDTGADASKTANGDSEVVCAHTIWLVVSTEISVSGVDTPFTIWKSAGCPVRVVPVKLIQIVMGPVTDNVDGISSKS